MLQDHREHCNCPGGRETGGRAAISRTGWCQRCGVRGSQRDEAIRAALAAQNWRPAIEDARATGYTAGYNAGLIEGRAQVINALLDPAALPRPRPIEAGPGHPWPPADRHPHSIGAAA